MNEQTILKQNSMIVSCHPFKKVLRSLVPLVKESAPKDCSLQRTSLKKQPSHQHVFYTSCSIFMSCLFFLFRFRKNSSVMLVSFNIVVFQNFLDNYCWWFRKPANNLRLVVLKSPLTRGFNTIPGWWSAAHSQLVPSCFGALRPARHVMRTCSNAGHGGENKKRVEDVQPLMTSKLFHQFSHEKCISNISMFV